jgi:hypothetical protein
MILYDIDGFDDKMYVLRFYKLSHPKRTGGMWDGTDKFL